MNIKLSEFPVGIDMFKTDIDCYFKIEVIRTKYDVGFVKFAIETCAFEKLIHVLGDDFL